MGQYTSYYLYQLYEKRGDQDWIPVYPNRFSIDADGTREPVVKKDFDRNCGYDGLCDPIYQWKKVPISEDYICDDCEVEIDTKFEDEGYYSYQFGLYQKRVMYVKLKTEDEWHRTDVVSYDLVTSDPMVQLTVLDPNNGKSIKCFIPWDSKSYGVNSYRQGYWYITNKYGVDKFSLYEQYREDLTFNFLEKENNIYENVVYPYNPFEFINIGYLNNPTYTMLASFYPVIWFQTTELYFNGYLVDIKFNSYGAMPGIWDDVKLEILKFGEGIESIGDESFSFCQKLKVINFPSTLLTIGNEAFYYCVSLENVSLPNSILSIGKKSFSVCKNLKTINFPSTLLTIGNEAFLGCESLKNIDLSSTKVKTIEEKTFYDCSSAVDVVLPDSLETIRTNSFYGCTNLKTITIPKNVSLIEAESFVHNYPGYNDMSNASYLDSVKFEGLVPPDIKYTSNIWFTMDPFGNKYKNSDVLTNNTEYIIPEQVVDLYDRELRLDIFKYSTYDPGNVYKLGEYNLQSNKYDILGYDDVLNLNDISRIGDLLGLSSGSNVNIKLNDRTKVVVGTLVNNTVYNTFFVDLSETKITELPSYFIKTTRGINITFPDTLNVIRSNAFSEINCSDMNLVLPESVTIIEKEAFKGATLRSFNYPSKVNKIDESTFENTKIYSSSNISFNGVEMVMDKAFLNMSFAMGTGSGIGLEFGNNLKYVGHKAFKGGHRLYLKGSTPPKFEYDFFEPGGSSIYIYVNEENIPLYEEALKNCTNYNRITLMKL